jgi:hypothetical protein
MIGMIMLTMVITTRTSARGFEVPVIVTRKKGSRRPAAWTTVA